VRHALVCCLCFVLTLVVALAISPRARADDAAQAEALFNAARELRDQGDFAAACPKFEASLKLDKQLGTLLNVAACHEQLGHWATAWARYKAALEWGEQHGDDRLDLMRQGRDRVAPKVPKLVINVANPTQELTIQRDGSEVTAAMYGMPLPVDPGEVTVRVFRGEDVLAEYLVTATESETSAFHLDLGAIAAAHPIASTAPVPKPVPKPAPTATPEPDEYDPTHRNVGLIVGGVGAVAALVAGGLGVAALLKKKQAQSDDACVNKFCSPDGLAAAEQAATFAEVGQWVGIGGLVTLAVGTTIFLTAPSEPEDNETALRPIPWLAPGQAGLAVGGRF